MKRKAVEKETKVVTTDVYDTPLKPCFVHLDKIIVPHYNKTDVKFSTANGTSTLNMKRHADSESSDDDLDVEKRTKLVEQDEDIEEMRDNGVNSYEQLILKRKAENLKYFNTLGIREMVIKAQETMDEMKELRKQMVPKRKKEPKEVTPIRKSSRLQNKPPPPISKSVEVAPEPVFKEKPGGPLAFQYVTLQEDASLTDTFVQDFRDLASEKLEKSVCPSFEWYSDMFPKMKISFVQKMVLSRIVSLCFHPSSKKLLVASGSKGGQIAFWDVEKEFGTGVYIYEPHSWNVSALEFNPSYLSEIVSSSYDGTLRCGNLEKAVFDELYRAPNESLCSSFNFISPSSFLVGERQGVVTVVDKRTNKKHGETSYRIFHTPLKNVSIHPQKKEYFIASSNSGAVSLCDLRKVKKTCVTQVDHPRSVNSAYFSPVTGNHILTTSMDHRLSIFDSSNLGGNMKMEMSIKHNNHTGRWLTPFRAVWLPNSEDGFVVGSMEYPRRIEVYKASGALAYAFQAELLASVCSINTFHPSVPALVGGNSSGKVFLFKAKS